MLGRVVATVQPIAASEAAKADELASIELAKAKAAARAKGSGGSSDHIHKLIGTTQKNPNLIPLGLAAQCYAIVEICVCKNLTELVCHAHPFPRCS